VQRAGEPAEVVVAQGQWAQLAGFSVRTQMWSLPSHAQVMCRARHAVGTRGDARPPKSAMLPDVGRSVRVRMGLGARIVVARRGLWTRARGGCGGGERKGRRRCGGSRQRRGQEERTHAASPLTPSNGLSTALAGTRLRLRSRGCARADRVLVVRALDARRSAMPPRRSMHDVDRSLRCGKAGWSTGWTSLRRGHARSSPQRLHTIACEGVEGAEGFVLIASKWLRGSCAGGIVDMSRGGEGEGALSAMRCASRPTGMRVDRSQRQGWCGYSCGVRGAGVGFGCTAVARNAMRLYAAERGG
jgi:hypothetical protein